MINMDFQTRAGRLNKREENKSWPFLDISMTIRDIVNFVFSTIGIYILIDIFGWSLWLMMNQTPMDGFFLGMFTNWIANILF